MPKRKLSASLEDYLEAILEIAAGGQGVRASEISQRLSVTRPSVTGALRLLRDRGLIHYEPYKQITLTPAGTAQARRVLDRHHHLYGFLHSVLLLPAESAEETACSMEHILPESTAGVFLAFTEFLTANPQLRDKLSASFQKFLDKRAAAEEEAAKYAVPAKKVRKKRVK